MDDLEYYKNICKVQSCILSFVGIEVGCRAMNWNDGGFPLFRRQMLNHVCGADDAKRILSLSNLTRDRALTLGFSLMERTYSFFQCGTLRAFLTGRGWSGWTARRLSSRIGRR